MEFAPPALLALIELMLAAATALEPHVGPILANLILAASFAGWADRLPDRQSSFQTVQAEAPNPLAGLAGLPGTGGQSLPPGITIAMLIEAVMIGYSLARRPKD